MPCRDRGPSKGVVGIKWPLDLSSYRDLAAVALTGRGPRLREDDWRERRGEVRSGTLRSGIGSVGSVG